MKCTTAAPLLKWPNDIIIQSKKAAGVVVDASIESGVVTRVIVGVGINFDIDIMRAEKMLTKTPNFYGITSIAFHDSNADRLELVQAFLEKTEECMTLLERGDSGPILARYARLSATMGRKVSAIHNGKRITGTAQKIDRDGSLVILTPGGIIRVVAEDVIHLRHSK